MKSSPNRTASAPKPASDLFPLLLILAGAFAVRCAWLFFRSFGVFNSDQAVIGLMAKHILEGKPMVYFYGQGYMGSLEAFAAALVFLVRGMDVVSLQMAPVLFYLSFLTVNFYLLKKVFGLKVSFIANSILAVSPPALSTLSMTALGGYPETLFFGSLVLYGLVCYTESRSKKTLFLTGLAAGVGFWVNNLILMYFFAAGIYLFLNSRVWKESRAAKEAKRFFFYDLKSFPAVLRLAAVGFHIWIIGYLLWQAFSFFAGPEEFNFLGIHFKPACPVFHVKKIKFIMRALLADAAIWTVLNSGIKKSLEPLKSAAPFAGGFLLGGSPAFLHTLFDGSGYRLIHASGTVYFKDLPAQWNSVMVNGLLGNMLSIPKENLFAAPSVTVWCVLIFSLVLAGSFFRFYAKDYWGFFRGKTVACPFSAYPLILLGVNAGICLFSNLQSVRYLMPVYFSLSLIFALGAVKWGEKIKGLAWILFLGLILSYGCANMISMKAVPSREQLKRDFEQAAGILQEKGVRGGYADYWMSYEMTFLSREKVIIAPFHSEDRYPAYTRFADGLEKAAYVFYDRKAHYESFEQKLKDHHIAYENLQAGQLRLFIVSRNEQSEKPFV